MATTFITTDFNGTTFLDDGDEIVITQGVNVTAPINAFDFSLVNGQVNGTYEITVAGNVYADRNFAAQIFTADSASPGDVELYLNVGLGASIYAGESLFVVDASDTDITDADLVIDNSGFISVTESAVSAAGFDYVEFINSGVLTQGASPGFPNQALFSSLGDGDAKIVNHGLMQSAQTSDLISQFLFSGDTLEVINSGTMTGGSGVAFDINGVGLGSFNVTNSGTIFGELDSFAKVSFTNTGLFFGNITTSDNEDKVENSGTITGRLIMFTNNDTLINSGEIIGIVDMGGDDDKIVNSGIINGEVNLDPGNDSFKTAGTGFVSDVINGNEGNDTIRGGTFEDTIDGGDDNDLLRGKGGDDELMGGSGNDTLFGGNDNDNLTGDAGDDDLRGGAGNDTLLGGGNRDRLVGGSDNDSLDGGQGNDTLLGGSGNDTLLGQNGQDALTGDAGQDVFVFSKLSHSAVGGTRDVIRDFEKGQDKIDIEGLSNDTFVFLGNSSFSGTGDAEVRVSTNAFGNSVVRIDANGDGTTDSEILVRGVTDLDAGDFIL